MFVLLLTPTISSARVGGEIRLYIPAFTGPNALGQNVATVLNLQIWQTLRKIDPKTGKDLGAGRIIWDYDTLERSDFDTADFVAKATRAQMLLWGMARVYGDGVVVQAYLSIPFYADDRLTRPEVWHVKIGESEVSMDLPARAYEFEPVVLTKAVISQYSLPEALKLCSTKVPSCRGPSVGGLMVAKRFEGDWAYIVNAKDEKGWVYMPALSQRRTEVPDFVGAVIRLHRGDYRGAVDLLGRVLSSKSLGPTMRFDALLLRARAHAEEGESGLEDAISAMEIDSYSASAVRTLVMSELSNRASVGGPMDPTAAQRLVALLKSKRTLFREEDPWLKAVYALLRPY